MYIVDDCLLPLALHGREKKIEIELQTERERKQSQVTHCLSSEMCINHIMKTTPS
jgi:hypothetical protein